MALDILYRFSTTLQVRCQSFYHVDNFIAFFLSFMNRKNKYLPFYSVPIILKSQLLT